MRVVQTPIPEDQYYPAVQSKSQIVLHHTVSNPTAITGDIDCWKADKARIATYCIISLDGTINRCFPSAAWAHHIGVKIGEIKALGFKDFMVRNEILNRKSIAIELDCWGGLTKKGGSFLNAYGKPIDKSLNVVECDWRGYKYYQSYSDAQVLALQELLPELMSRYNIPAYGIRDGNFDQRKDAVGGVPGIYSHSSYRADKSDLYPDTRLIQMLKTL